MDTTALSLSFANLLAMHAFVIAKKRYALAHEEADLPVVSQTMSAMIGFIDEINEYVPAGQAWKDTMKIGDKVKSLVWCEGYLANVDAIVIDVDHEMIQIAYIVANKKLYGWVPRLAIES